VDRIVVASTAGCDTHDTGRRHPEGQARLDAALRGIQDAALGDALAVVSPRPATRDELAHVHDPRYLDALEQFARDGGGQLDPDTVVSEGSFDTARLAVGSGLVAIDSLRAGDAVAAFVAVRPPGHHAASAVGRGFCLLNSIAVCAATLAAAGERVLIVDWDVHHGNGTQDIFWDDPRVLYASTHQWPWYPGTGRASETGGPRARGLTVNVPLPAGATGDVALAALDDVVAPAAGGFAPTWVLASAGFDAHRTDPLAALEWSAGDYALLTRRVAALAPGPGRLVAFLEGGYDLDALSRCVTATVRAMAGLAIDAEAPTSGGPGRRDVETIARGDDVSR
jgi:acetoin utilization deacetylase AcuC-like enzyme